MSGQDRDREPDDPDDRGEERSGTARSPARRSANAAAITRSPCAREAPARCGKRSAMLISVRLALRHGPRGVAIVRANRARVHCGFPIARARTRDPRWPNDTCRTDPCRRAAPLPFASSSRLGTLAKAARGCRARPPRLWLPIIPDSPAFVVVPARATGRASSAARRASASRTARRLAALERAGVIRDSIKAMLALTSFARYHEQMNVLRLRGESELYEFEGLLAGDDPVRLVLHNGNRDFGMVLNWSNASFTLLRSDGSVRAYPYAHVLCAQTSARRPFRPVFEALLDRARARGADRRAPRIGGGTRCFCYPVASSESEAAACGFSPGG